MNKISMRIILVFFISLAFCSEHEKYTLQFGFDWGEYGTEYIEKWKHQQEVSFNIPGIGFVKYAATYTSLSQYLGIDGEFYKFKATLTDMESDNIVSGVKILDYYREAMENNPCYIYVKIDGNGLIDHIDPVDPENDHLQEAYEGAYMAINSSRYKYPFGSAAENVAVDDTWTSSFDSSKFYVNMGSPPSRWWSTATWNLKRVKDKRGIKTAYIDVIDEIRADLNMAVDFYGERRLISGNASGKSDA